MGDIKWWKIIECIHNLTDKKIWWYNIGIIYFYLISMSTKSIVVGGGCFWCTEAIFNKVPGVLQVTSGYAGGHTKNPTYREISANETGHAEVVKIDFDTDQISLTEIFTLFFKTHDPTTFHRQGADVGSQYRSIILYENEEDKETAVDVIEKISEASIYPDPFVTEVEKLDVFYEAEEYHQDFYAKNPSYGYCSVVINPKLKKLDTLLKKEK